MDRKHNITMSPIPNNYLHGVHVVFGVGRGTDSQNIRPGSEGNFSSLKKLQGPEVLVYSLTDKDRI